MLILHCAFILTFLYIWGPSYTTFYLYGDHYNVLPHPIGVLVSISSIASYLAYWHNHYVNVLLYDSFPDRSTLSRGISWCHSGTCSCIICCRHLCNNFVSDCHPSQVNCIDCVNKIDLIGGSKFGNNIIAPLMLPLPGCISCISWTVMMESGGGIERSASKYGFGNPTLNFYAIFWQPHKIRMNPRPFYFTVNLNGLNIWHVMELACQTSKGHICSFFFRDTIYIFWIIIYIFQTLFLSFIIKACARPKHWI